MSIAGRPAEVLYAGAAPRFVGVRRSTFDCRTDFQPTAFSVSVTVGGAESRQGITVWAR